MDIYQNMTIGQINLLKTTTEIQENNQSRLSKKATPAERQPSEKTDYRRWCPGRAQGSEAI